VRIKKFSLFEAVNYDHWNICRAAMELGNKQQLPVYRFVKNALNAKYGNNWFNRLEEAASNLHIEKNP